MVAGMGAIGLLALLIGLVSLVMFIMVLIRQFQTAGAVHGIIGIVTCGIWTFIWGWMNAANLNLKKIMMIWTAAIVVSLILNVIGGGLAASQLTAPTAP